MKRITVVIVCALLLAAAASETATADSGQMGQPRAGKYYLRAMCPETPAINRLSRTLPANKHGYWYTRDLTPKVFRRVKAASRHLSTVYFTAARHLYNPPAAWPSEVRAPVSKVARLTRRESNVSHDLGNAYTPRGFTRIWNNRYEPLWNPVRNAGSTVRAKLDLPAPGKGCHR